MSAYRGQADMQTPPDPAQALAANPNAAATFEQLDAANRYSIVYRLNAVKRPATRWSLVPEGMIALLHRHAAQATLTRSRSGSAKLLTKRRSPSLRAHGFVL